MTKPTTHVTGDLRLRGEHGGDITARRIGLLEAIEAEGSIAAAAKSQGMSYRSAWDAVNEMNNLWTAPLVEKTPGGSRGGGTRLTQQGRELIASFRLMQEEYRRFTHSLGRNLGEFERFSNIIGRLSMRSSARNQFQGTVLAISEGAVNSEITLAINDKDRITAIITKESVEHLGLTLGSEAFALIKASFVILAPADEHCITSARNRLCGTVRELRHGAVNSEVVVELDGGKTLIAIVTEESAHNLALGPGSPVCALIKASHVILGVN